MGFCLLECAEMRGLYIAVNPAHVDAIVEAAPGDFPFPVSLIRFVIEIPDFKPLVIGDEKAIKKLLMQALKLGTKRVESVILGGMGRGAAAPMLINHPDRIVMIREMLPEEFIDEAKSVPVASALYFTDKSIRKVAQRPGTFAKSANQNGKVPVLGAA